MMGGALGGWLFVLRPFTAEGLPMGSVAFDGSNGVRNHRSMATEFATLARSCMRCGNFGVLVGSSSQ
jgi:hypothetical protein